MVKYAKRENENGDNKWKMNSEFELFNTITGNIFDLLQFCLHFFNILKRI